MKIFSCKLLYKFIEHECTFDYNKNKTKRICKKCDREQWKFVDEIGRHSKSWWEDSPDDKIQETIKRW